MDTTAHLISRINLLESKLDSLNHLSSLNEINYKLTEQGNIITQVNAFYDSAWLKLIFVITLLGIVIPIIAQYFQKRSFKDLTDFILNQIRDSYDNKIQELKTYNDTQIQVVTLQFKNEFEKLKNEGEQLTKEITGATNFLQAKTYFDVGKFEDAYVDSMRATCNYINGRNPNTSKVAIKNAHSSLRNIKSKEQLSRVENERFFETSKAFTFLKEHPKYEIIKEEFELLEKLYSELL